MHPLMSADCVRVLHVFSLVVSSRYRVWYVNILLFFLPVLVHFCSSACKLDYTTVIAILVLVLLITDEHEISTFQTL